MNAYPNVSYSYFLCLLCMSKIKMYQTTFLKKACLCWYFGGFIMMLRYYFNFPVRFQKTHSKYLGTYFFLVHYCQSWMFELHSQIKEYVLGMCVRLLLIVFQFPCHEKIVWVDYLFLDNQWTINLIWKSLINLKRLFVKEKLFKKQIIATIH